MCNTKLKREHPSKHRLFVLCSDKFKDNPVYAVVQGSHAMAEYLKEEIYDFHDCCLYDENYQGEYWENNNTIVYCWYDHKKLQYYNHPFGCMSNKHVPYYIWKEPDQDNVVTAACFWEDDYMNIDNHDNYWYSDPDDELDYSERELKKLQLVK